MLLDLGLNKFPSPPETYQEMNDKQLQKAVAEHNKEPKYTIKFPKLVPDYPDIGFRKADVQHLVLSTHNEVNLGGCASVLEEFKSDFGIKNGSESANLLFHKNDKFDLQRARERYKFHSLIHYHQKQHDIFLKECDFECEKSCDVDECEDDEIDHETISFTKDFESTNHECKRIYNDLKGKVSGHSTDEIINLVSKDDIWVHITDGYGRTLLHYVVEDDDEPLLCHLLKCGGLVNKPEGCGVTSLLLACIFGKTNLAKVLLENGAVSTGPLFAGLPTPKQVATMLKNDILLEILTNHETKTYDRKHRILHNFLSISQTDHKNASDVPSGCGSNDNQVPSKSLQYILTAGDQKTAQNTRLCRNRDTEKYSMFQEVPGDFHAIAHLISNVMSVYGPGGLYYICKHVLNRPKCSPETFQKMLKERNYERNEDCFMLFLS